MVRYLGQKPVNWAAMVLVYGWMAVGGVYMLWGAGAVSMFRAGLAEAPLMWWPEISFVGLVLTLSPLLFGFLAMWLVPVSDWSIRLSVTLVALGVGFFIGGVAWDSSYGVALYSDRVAHRAAGFGQPLHIDRFADVRRVETGCVVMRGRGGGGADPSYILEFANGHRVDIWRGSYSGTRGSAAERFAVVQAADAEVVRVGALRAPQRKPDGTLIGDVGCIERLADTLTIPPPVISPLFGVHRSELRPGEYEIDAEGDGA
ncbi:hypothetical protein [Brevundimonas sp.]|uniref:hypothetical protein n=1 Tax=Brevundimonas sp. TaxID=1871086 RepID=UPI003F71C293